MSLVVSDPHRAYPTQGAAWGRFGSIFKAISGLVTYVPIFKAYFRQALQTFYDDNVLYLEVRALLPPVSIVAGFINRNAGTSVMNVIPPFDTRRRHLCETKMCF